MTPEDPNPNFDQPFSPIEEEQIAKLSTEQTEQIIEQALMPLDPEDDGIDAARGIFRPEHLRWRTLIQGGVIRRRSRVKERTLTLVHDDATIKALQNSYLHDPERYVTEAPLTENTLCWYPDNSVMLLYLKNCIPLRARTRAKEGLDAMVFDEPTRSETQNATMFNARLGTPLTVAGELLFGFMDRGWIMLTPLMRRLNALFARTLPRDFAKQNGLIPAPFRQYGTAYSNVSILKSCPSAIHRDTGNSTGSDLSLTCLTTVGTEGEYSGGEFCLLQYGLKIPVKPGDILIAATCREWHLNLTPVKGTKYSIICYFRRGLTSRARLEEWSYRSG
jgi:hypothetical protein